MNCILKRFIIKTINKLLDDYKDNISVAKEKVWTWLKRSEAVNKFLRGLYEKLSDNNLTEEELKSTIEEFRQMLEGWKKERV